MAQLLKGPAWLLVVLIVIGLVAGPRVALAILIAFVGLFVGLRNGYFRKISSEQFVLYDCYGRMRGQLAGGIPPPSHVMGADWDPVPGLELYYRTGEKAAALTVDFNNGESSAGLVLFGDSGLSAIGITNFQKNQRVFFKNGRSNRDYALRVSNTGTLLFVDSLGNEKKIV